MLRLGTRASVLARTQSGQVAAAVTALTGMPCELLPIRSEARFGVAECGECGEEHGPFQDLVPAP